VAEERIKAFVAENALYLHTLYVVLENHFKAAEKGF
jgi:hypothetical protein